MACFTSDVEMFVEVFTTDKKAELFGKLVKYNDTLSTPPTKALGLSISLSKIKQQLLLGDMFKSSASGEFHTVAYEYIFIIYSPKSFLPH